MSRELRDSWYDLIANTFGPDDPGDSGGCLVRWLLILIIVAMAAMCAVSALSVVWK